MTFLASLISQIINRHDCIEGFIFILTEKMFFFCHEFAKQITVVVFKSIEIYSSGVLRFQIDLQCLQDFQDIIECG